VNRETMAILGPLLRAVARRILIIGGLAVLLVAVQPLVQACPAVHAIIILAVLQFSPDYVL